MLLVAATEVVAAPLRALDALARTAALWLTAQLAPPVPLRVSASPSAGDPRRTRWTARSRR
jgi:hypothetical protein